MKKPIVAAAVAMAIAVLSPAALAGGLVPVNPIVNSDFDTYLTPGAASALKAVMDNCVGVGHQALIPLYSEGGDAAIAIANDPATAPENAPVVAEYGVAYAGTYAADPNTAHECDPQYRDLAGLNAWAQTRDRGFAWSNDPGTLFDDFDGDGDVEAIVPAVPAEHTHNFWQSMATSTQAFSANFEAFEFTVESGTPSTRANVQVGLALSPSYMQHPWLGAFWEGAVLFRANDFQPDADGRVSMDPVLDGEIICPGGYTPCFAFKADYDAADEAGKRTLLGQARLVQTSFWSFHNGVAPVAIDDVAYVGATSAVETTPNPNPSAEL